MYQKIEKIYSLWKANLFRFSQNSCSDMLWNVLKKSAVCGVMLKMNYSNFLWLKKTLKKWNGDVYNIRHCVCMWCVVKVVVVFVRPSLIVHNGFINADLQKFLPTACPMKTTATSPINVLGSFSTIYLALTDFPFSARALQSSAVFSQMLFAPHVQKMAISRFVACTILYVSQLRWV